MDMKGKAAQSIARALAGLKQERKKINVAIGLIDAKARLWCDLLGRGCILRFRAPDGEEIVAGPLPLAVGGGLYGARRYGKSRWSWPRSPCGEHEGSAWAVALWVIDNVGRVRPYSVTGTTTTQRPQGRK